MPTCHKFIKERLELLDSILQKGFDLKTGRLWMIEPSHLRFRLGESIKDLKIPCLFGGEDESIIEKSILSLLILLKRRFEPGSEHEIKDSLRSNLFPIHGHIKTNPKWGVMRYQDCLAPIIDW